MTGTQPVRGTEVLMAYRSVQPEKSKVKGVPLERVDAIRLSSGWVALGGKPKIVPAFIGGARFGGKPWALSYETNLREDNYESVTKIVNLANLLEVSLTEGEKAQP